MPLTIPLKSLVFYLSRLSVGTNEVSWLTVVDLLGHFELLFPGLVYGRNIFGVVAFQLFSPGPPLALVYVPLALSELRYTQLRKGFFGGHEPLAEGNRQPPTLFPQYSTVTVPGCDRMRPYAAL